MKKHNGVQKLKKFSMSLADTDETVAVVEAVDADDAFARFLKIRRVIRRQLVPDPGKLWKIEQTSANGAITYLFFSGPFFDVVEASEATKH